MASPTLRIGLFGIGLDTYWPQFPGLKPRLVTDAESLPGSRVIEGRCTSVKQLIGTPRGRDAGANYLREFVEDVKTSGLVARLIAEYRVRGVSVAPPAQFE